LKPPADAVAGVAGISGGGGGGGFLIKRRNESGIEVWNISGQYGSVT
jgi:hypothetical protein